MPGVWWAWHRARSGADRQTPFCRAVPTLAGRRPHQQGPSDSAPLSPAELPSVMLLNGDCPESLKKEEGAAEPPRENGLDENEPGEETTGQEVIVIQDTGFSVKILAPGIEPFSLQVR